MQANGRSGRTNVICEGRRRVFLPFAFVVCMIQGENGVAVRRRLLQEAMRVAVWQAKG